MKCSISTYYKILDAELYDFDDGYTQLKVDIDTKNIDLEEYVSMQKKSIADMCNVPEERYALNAGSSTAPDRQCRERIGKQKYVLTVEQSRHLTL